MKPRRDSTHAHILYFVRSLDDKRTRENILTNIHQLKKNEVKRRW
jgi:hypothetical protein